VLHRPVESAGLIGIWGLGATKFRPEPQKHGFFRASSCSAIRRPGTSSKCEYSVLFHFPVSRRKRGNGSLSVQSWNTLSDDANCTKVITLGYTEGPKNMSRVNKRSDSSPLNIRPPRRMCCLEMNSHNISLDGLCRDRYLEFVAAFCQVLRNRAYRYVGIDTEVNWSSRCKWFCGSATGGRRRRH
jgi:hypothetical protein